MANTSNSRAWPKLIVRLPPEVKAWLAREAAHNTSSQNSEIVRCIRERIDRQSASADAGREAP